MWMCLWGAQGQVEFRAVGGQGEEFGEVVVPHGTGAFLLGSTQLPNTQDVRGYVVHYDQSLNVDWTALTPGDVMFEMAMDGWSDEAGMVDILTWRLTTEDGYHAAIHTFDSTGVWHGTMVPPLTQGFRPTCSVKWLGARWVVGAIGNRPTAISLETGELKHWGGENGVNDEIRDAMVVNNLLVSVGSRTEAGQTRTAIWGMYPLGQMAFEFHQPDTVPQTWSQAEALALGLNGNVRVLQSYERNLPSGGGALLHSLISLNALTGNLNGFLYGPTAGERPGRDLAFTEGGWLKLTQTDVVTALDQSMLLTHYTPGGGYIGQGAWGTLFEDDPSRLTVDSLGQIWVAGSTRGALNDTWNACLLRIDSLGPLDNWSLDTPGFGVHNDLLFTTLDVDHAPEGADTWRLLPNLVSPGTERIRIDGPLSSQSHHVTWTLLDGRGREAAQGRGRDVRVGRLTPGRHVLVVHDGLRARALDLVVAGHQP
jgi:hypothetical protein